VLKVWECRILVKTSRYIFSKEW